MAVARGLLGLALIAMVALNVANALGRYLFGRAIEGSDELLVFTMIALVFLGAPLVAAEGRHLRFDALAGRLPGRRLVETVGLAFAALLLGWLAWHSLGAVERLAGLGQRSMALGLPMAIPHAAVTAGLGLSALVALGALLGRVGRGRP